MGESLKIPKSFKNDYEKEIIEKRLKFIQENTKASFSHIRQYSFDPLVTKGNIENFIGVAQIPLGIAGPLKINGEEAKGDFFIPLATVEGALVISYDRGMLMLSRSGGVTVKVLKENMHISPIFRVENFEDGQILINWVKENYKKIKQVAESTTRYGKLLSIEPIVIGKGVILKFCYSTADAMGTNMVAIATEEACKYISSSLKKKFFIKSNFSSDKKVSSYNYVCGYGKTVFAEATVPSKLVKLMGTTPEEMFEYYKTYILGSNYAGIVGMNGHVANGVAALFLACGQDVAEVISASTAICSGEVTPEGDAYISLHFPSLMVGTVGGGTSLPTQKECLEILGCYGPGKIKKFTEIVAAVALAGEFSICAAIAGGTFVDAFKKYGRKKLK